MSECIVLGTDECDAEVQRDLWLKEHPGIKINRVHPPKREPPNLLTRFGSKKSLRVSILIDYELPEAAEGANRHSIDIAERFKELQQLRIRVYTAELDFLRQSDVEPRKAVGSAREQSHPLIYVRQ
jgi:hypothetical protein